LEAYEVRRGTLVRVRDDFWRTDFIGVFGTVQRCWGHQKCVAVDVALEDGRSALFLLYQLDAVDQAVVA
jgi:hypothetical protein